ncbi:hypothetical protein [Bacillus andreraoultii]|uniref:hypothetical protein n=1 Tax=Bacillus andreraoultii TaxID=1499685 RepID=UPI00053A51D1|nr:hypothetical protein [Bacillus andreraoultii]
MLIEAIEIKIKGQSGKEYGRYINFTNKGKTKEINLIYGKNTLGKSTLIESLIFGLSGEDIYPQKKKNDVADYSLIIDKFFNDTILESEVLVQLNNEKERIVICRNTLEKSEPVKVYWNCSIENYKESKKVTYLKVKKDRNIKGNKTYQEFLFEYFGIPIYKNTPAFGEKNEIETQGNTLIFYIQNLLPLFIINQHAWGDIQAINPRYGLKDVKKIAFDVIMGFSNTTNITDKFLLNSLHSELRQKKSSIVDVEEVLSTSKFKDFKTLDEEITSLHNELDMYRKKLVEIENAKIDDNNILKPFKDKYKRLMSLKKRFEEKIVSLDNEIKEYDFYLNKILMDIEKLDKLKTAKKLIGSLPVKKCPHCNNEVTIDEDYELETNHCSVCSHEMMSRNYSKPDELLGYLIDEEKDFRRLKNIKVKERAKIESNLFIVKLDLLEIQKTIEDFQGELKPYNLKEYHLVSREIGRINNTIINLQKDREIILKYENLRGNIEVLNNKIDTINQRIKNNESKVDDKTKLKFFQRNFKKYLSGLDFLKDGIDYSRVVNSQKDNMSEEEAMKVVSEEIYKDIIIDDEDYLPKLNNRNLYSITSSSGLIRIILAYYLALLRTGLEFKKATNHPLILILDEPRQQNLDLESYNKFTNFLIKLRKKFPSQFEIILASGDKGSLSESDISLNLENNYLIQER